MRGGGLQQDPTMSAREDLGNERRRVPLKVNHSFGHFDYFTVYFQSPQCTVFLDGRTKISDYVPGRN